MLSIMRYKLDSQIYFVNTIHALPASAYAGISHKPVFFLLKLGVALNDKKLQLQDHNLL